MKRQGHVGIYILRCIYTVVDTDLAQVQTAGNGKRAVLLFGDDGDEIPPHRPVLRRGLGELLCRRVSMREVRRSRDSGGAPRDHRSAKKNKRERCGGVQGAREPFIHVSCAGPGRGVIASQRAIFAIATHYNQNVQIPIVARCSQ